MTHVARKQELMDKFDQQARDHPVGLMAIRYVDEVLKRHPPEPRDKSHKKKTRRSSSSDAAKS
jgi:hypothetical protein